MKWVSCKFQIDGTFISNRQHSDVVDLIKNKSEIKMTLMHRSSTLPGDLAQRLQGNLEILYNFYIWKKLKKINL